MVFLISSISCCFFFASSLDCAAFSRRSARSASNFSTSPLIRSMLTCANSTFCLMFAVSSWILDSFWDASFSSFACSSKIFWNAFASSLISCSRYKKNSISSRICFLLLSISSICCSICCFSPIRPVNTASLSLRCCFARSTFIFAVF